MQVRDQDRPLFPPLIREYDELSGRAGLGVVAGWAST